jgi:hypothetical protein
MLSLLHHVSSAKIECLALVLRTFETFVPVVLVDEDIVCSAQSVTPSSSAGYACALTALIFAGRQRGRRKSETLHLRRLRQQRPSRRLWHAVGLYNSAAGLVVAIAGLAAVR